MGGYSEVDNEHSGELHAVPATGNINEPLGELPTVSVQLWWNADVEPAPQVHLSLNDGSADLQLNEAVLLCEYLRRITVAASAGTAIDHARIIGRAD